MKYVKLASIGDLDDLPTTGDEQVVLFVTSSGKEDPRDESSVWYWCSIWRKILCTDVRVIRLPRHAASCPVGLCSCSADRNIRGKITEEGVFLEQLEYDPARYAPHTLGNDTDEAPIINLDRPMEEILAELSSYPSARVCA